MKRKLTRFLTISCLLALLVGSLDSVAQEKEVRKDELKVPPDTFKVLATKFAFGKVVKGAPYSATATTETIQKLNDGNQIIHKNQSKLYRDNEGRTRIEQTLGTIGKWTAGGEAQQIIFINDPVAGFSFSLDPRTRTAYKGETGLNVKDPGDLAERVRLNQLAQEKMKAQKEMMLEVNRAKLRDKPPAGADPPPQITWEGTTPRISISKDGGSSELQEYRDGRRKTELLGKQMIEGVEVQLTRSTLTIPAGEIGNTSPIEVVDETWYSPELQMLVMSKHRDPRSGETTYRLININRSEPDRALFEVPADYSVKENTILPKPKRPNNPGEEQEKGGPVPKPRRLNNPEEEQEN